MPVTNNPIYDKEAYVEMIVSNLWGGVEGDSACKPLASAVAAGNREYFKTRIAAVIDVIVSERDEAREDRLSSAKHTTDDDFLFETIYQNIGGSVHIADHNILERLRSRIEKARG